MEEREREALLEQAFAQDQWYHTIELAPGRVTPGLVDLRSVAPRLLPGHLAGVRALDVGTFDGFWAFELERRGATVVAADLDDYLDSDWPPPTKHRLGRVMAGRLPGERFGLAHQLLDSGVERVGCSIYDLAPERVGGTFGFAVVGALLLHLRDPVGGLEAVRSVLEPGSWLLVVEPIDVRLTVLHPRSPAARLRTRWTDFDWWVGNVSCLKEFLRLAGFEGTVRRRLFRVDAVPAMRQWHVALEARRPRAG